jgi:hypothetical protein
MNDLFEDEIIILEFMEFQDQSYKYIKHFHKSMGQVFQCKQPRGAFTPRTILLVVEFVKSYTCSPQREI